MSKSKNRAYNRYEPENRKTDSKRYKMDRKERAKFSVRLHHIIYDRFLNV